MMIALALLRSKQLLVVRGKYDDRMVNAHEPLKRARQLCSACFLGARLGRLRDPCRAFCTSGTGRGLGRPGECNGGVRRRSVGGEVRRNSIGCIRRRECDFGDAGARGDRGDSRGSAVNLEDAYRVARRSASKDSDSGQTNGGHIVDLGGGATALANVGCNELVTRTDLAIVEVGCNDLVSGGGDLGDRMGDDKSRRRSDEKESIAEPD